VKLAFTSKSRGQKRARSLGHGRKLLLKGLATWRSYPPIRWKILGECLTPARVEGGLWAGKNTPFKAKKKSVLRCSSSTGSPITGTDRGKEKYLKCRSRRGHVTTKSKRLELFREKLDTQKPKPLITGGEIGKSLRLEAESA